MSECCYQDKKIVEVTSCIFAAAWTYEDGTTSCGLEGSDRDCHWCYKYLEQKTQRKEEGCKYGRMVGYAKHPSLPWELCSVWEMLYPDGSFAWWDVGVEMYSSLREAIQHGWEMKFDWEKEEKEPVSMRCLQYQCRANSEYGLCYPDPKSATCCIETTAPELLDQHAESCGFIRVSDCWTTWKYGVPYKDLKCGNCQHYDGELHGVCRLENKGRFSGAQACEEFKKREVEEVVINDNQKCKSKDEKCKYYCKHNEGCALLIVKGDSLISLMEDIGDPGCDMYRVMSQSVQKSKNTEAEETALEVPVSNTVQAFDYSTVDEETAAFLQEKAQKILQMRMTFMLSVARELKEVHNRLANHYKGTFGVWCESIGISRFTANNYIKAYDYVVENFNNIEDAEKIQPSLLFAISKPSAPKELQQAVLNGDIKTHKEYKELEAKLKAEEDRRKAAEAELEEETKLRQKAERQAENAENQRRILEEQNRRLLNERNELEKQLEAAKESGDSEQIETLKQALKALDEEVTKLRNERDNLQRQVKEKPIEATAVREVVKEVIPDEIRAAISTRVESALLTVNDLTDAELKMFANNVADFAKEEYAEKVDEIIERLNFLKSLLIGKSDDYTGNCGMCKFADMDRVTEEQLDENKTWCTLEDIVVDFEHRCTRFEMVGN